MDSVQQSRGDQEQSKQWMHTCSLSKPKKFKQSLTSRKTMATVCWDTKVMFLVDFMEQGTTLTKEVHNKTVFCLVRAI